jgi:hypothetical protein
MVFLSADRLQFQGKRAAALWDCNAFVGEKPKENGGCFDFRAAAQEV